MPIEEKFEKFLPTILDVIYGIVIIAGFGVAIKISFPLTNLIPHMDVSYTFSNYNGLITAIALIFLYVLVISSWISHRKSLRDRVYLGFLGNVRFVLDIIILFFYSYFITFLSSDATKYNGIVYTYFEYFGNVFLWGLPIVFSLYVIWDAIKFQEYKNHLTTPSHSGRIIPSIIFSILFLVQALLWLYFFGYERTQNYLSYFVPIVMSIMLVPDISANQMDG